MEPDRLSASIAARGCYRKRSDESRVADYRSFRAQAASARPTSPLVVARRPLRRLLCASDRLPVAVLPASFILAHSLPLVGRKRHAMVDTGRALELMVHPADVQNRDGAVPLLKMSRGRHLFVEIAYADSAYNSPRVAERPRSASRSSPSLPTRPASSCIPGDGWSNAP